MTNYKAMQVAATIQEDAKRNKTKIHAKPGDVLPRYMSMGSWKASLSQGGRCKQNLKGQSIK